MYEERMVAFIDILGFREIIKHTVTKKGVEKTIEVDELARTLDEWNEQMLAPEDWIWGIEGYKSSPSIKTTQFSDSIVVSCLLSRPHDVFEMLKSLLWGQIKLLENNIICRGGISIGNILHTDNRIFGTAMLNAYNLEKHSANSPRIIFGKEVFVEGQRAAIQNNEAKHLHWSMDSVSKVDSDDYYYLDYFDSIFVKEYCVSREDYLLNLRKKINSGLRNKDSRIRDKYSWMLEKFSEIPKKTSR